MIGRNETAHFIHNLPLLMCGAFEWLRSRTGGSDCARAKLGRSKACERAWSKSVREVRLEGTRSGIGTVAGGVAGGIGGAHAAHGWLRALGALAGAVAGGLLDQVAEEGVTGRKGLEIRVRLDNGSLVAITQVADEEFRPASR
jgi:outer membrane lipoprotein SlyB